jgi:tetratricopeptide (TPR) repeat protein
MTRRHAAWTFVLLVILLALGGTAWWYGVERPARLRRDADARGRVARGQDYLQRGRPDLALRTIAEVPEDGPWAAGALAVKGLSYAALNRPEQARPFLERSLARDPAQPMVAKVLAAVCFSANEADRGFKLLESAARLDEDDFRPWFAAGDIILRFRYPPADAVRAFREALKRRPDHEESRIGLADALLATGAAAEAAPLLAEVRRDHAADPRVLCLAARYARLQGQPEQMGRYAAEALELDPDRLEALLLRAQYLHLARRHDEALPLAERAVGLAPDDLAGLHLLASIEAALGRTEQAAATSARHRRTRERNEQMQLLTNEIRKRPEDPEPRWRMGQLAARSGMTALALSSFRTALALDPDCRPAREGLLALGRQAATPAPGEQPGVPAESARP